MSEQEKRQKLARQFANILNTTLQTWAEVGLNPDQTGIAHLEFITGGLRFELTANYEVSARTFSMKVTKA